MEDLCFIELKPHLPPTYFRDSLYKPPQCTKYFKIQTPKGPLRDREQFGKS